MFITNKYYGCDSINDTLSILNQPCIADLQQVKLLNDVLFLVGIITSFS